VGNAFSDALNGFAYLSVHVAQTAWKYWGQTPLFSASVYVPNNNGRRQGYVWLVRACQSGIGLVDIPACKITGYLF
jgi:hypothetical protein